MASLQELIEQRRFEEAIESQKPASDAGNAAQSNNLAIVYRHMGDPAGELYYAQRAYNQGPLLGGAVNTLMRAYRSNGMNHAVVDLYRSRASILGLERIHHLWAAEALIAINRTDEAGAVLQRLGDFPASVEYELTLALEYARAVLDYDRALALIQQLKDLRNQNDPTVGVLFEAGRMSEALAYFDAHAATDPAVYSTFKAALLAAIAMEDRAAVERLAAQAGPLSPGMKALVAALLRGDASTAVQGKQGHYVFPFAPTNLSIALPHAVGEFYEAEMLARVQQLLSPGQTVIDVGANIGNHTVYFAGEVGCSVVSFECNPRLVPLLTQTVNRADLAERVNLSYLGAAVTNQVGSVRFNFMRDDYSNVMAADGGGDVTPSVSLDSLHLAEAHLIKIDVYGGELAVLKGMEETIARLKPYVWIEVMNANTLQTLSWFDAQGYGALREDTTNATYSDFVFGPRSGPVRVLQ